MFNDFTPFEKYVSSILVAIFIVLGWIAGIIT